jgi:hypothetical protein
MDNHPEFFLIYLLQQQRGSVAFDRFVFRPIEAHGIRGTN